MSSFRRSQHPSVVFFLLLLIACTTRATKKCVPRSYPGDDPHSVCVCTADACDDIEPIGKLADGEAAVYWSDVKGRRMDKVVQRLEETATSSILEVDDSVLHQSIIGFGGAFTDAAAINTDSLSEAGRKKLLEQYFGENGAAYTLGRIPMASTDFSTREYSYDEFPGDFDLIYFDLADEDRLHKIPMIKDAMTMVAAYNSSIRFFGSPWSAPAWMKSNGAMVGGGKLRGFPGGVYYVTWAKYFVKFLEAYAAAGIRIWAVTVQNEPTTGSQPDFLWQTMDFNAKSERDFIKGQLGPALRNSSIGKNVKIMILDDQRPFLKEWANTIFADEEATKYADGIGVHWYQDYLYPDPSPLSETHKRWPDKFILATEACNGWLDYGKGVILGDFGRAIAYAHSIIEDLNNFVSGWTDWNLALDLKGGPNFVNNVVDSPIIVDAARGEFLKQPAYYALTHFSRFLRPGSRRCGLTVPSTGRPVGAEAVAAVVDEGRRAVVLLNRDRTKSWSVSLRDRSSPGRFLNLELPPQSIVTAVWNVSQQ